MLIGALAASLEDTEPGAARTGHIAVVVGTAVADHLPDTSQVVAGTPAYMIGMAADSVDMDFVDKAADSMGLISVPMY